MKPIPFQQGLFPEPDRQRAVTARGRLLRSLVMNGWHPYTVGLRRPLAIKAHIPFDLFPKEGPTCGTCRWLQPLDRAPGSPTWSTRVFKCWRYPEQVTRGSGTDIRKGWPACVRWEEITDGDVS